LRSCPCRQAGFQGKYEVIKKVEIRALFLFISLIFSESDHFTLFLTKKDKINVPAMTLINTPLAPADQKSDKTPVK